MIRKLAGALLGATLPMFLIAGCPATPTDTSASSDQSDLLTASNRLASAVAGLVDGAATTTTTSSSPVSSSADAANNAAEDSPLAAPDADALLAEPVGFDAIDVSEDEIAGDVAYSRDGDARFRHGGLAGRFLNERPHSNSDTSPGMFRGDWFNAVGEVTGHVEGHYHPIRPADLPPGIVGGGEFEGRLTWLDGRPGGMLRGHYGHERDARGRFIGRWFNGDGELIGALRGHWDDVPGTDGGVFAGRWGAYNVCDESDSLSSDPAIAEVDSLDFAGLDAMAQAAADELLAAGTDDAGAIDTIDAQIDVALSREDGMPPCGDPGRPHGFLYGRHWRERPNPDMPRRPHGRFAGNWANADREIVAHIAGEWIAREPMGGDGEPLVSDDGADSAGLSDAAPLDELLIPGQPADGDGTLESRPPGRAHVLGLFRGAIIGRGDEVRGYLRGAFGRSAHGVMVFRGQFFGRDEQPLGEVRGRWDTNGERPGGPFFGMWIAGQMGDGDPLVSTDADSTADAEALGETLVTP